VKWTNGFAAAPGYEPRAAKSAVIVAKKSRRCKS
jgi:hypothetical protein